MAPDKFARWALVLPSSLILIFGLIFDWKLSNSDALLAGAALLAGGLLSAFGQVATWRGELKRSSGPFDPSPDEQLRRDQVDETATHLLLAAYLSGLVAVFIVVGSNVATDSKGRLTSPLAAIIMSLGTYLALLFFIVVPRLYTAYVEVSDVRDVLDGHRH